MEKLLAQLNVKLPAEAWDELEAYRKERSIEARFEVPGAHAAREILIEWARERRMRRQAIRSAAG